MIQLRELKTAEEGFIYSSECTVIVEDQSGQRIVMCCNPDGLYEMMHKSVVAMSTFGAGESPEDKKKKNLAKLVKTGVKGLLIAFGDQILDMMLGPNHEKPGKGVDLLDWYQDLFTRIGISWLMRNDVVLRGRFVDGTTEQSFWRIDRVSTRSLSEEIESGDGTGEYSAE